MKTSKSVAVQLDIKMRRVEECFCELIYAGEALGFSGQSNFDIQRKRASLAQAARNYSAAIRSLARIKN